MDWTTTYGVHPFWPFDARWFYGDAVFIVEPLFWAAAAPLIGLLQSRWRRVAVALVIGATLALLISTGLLPRAVQVLVVVALLAGLLIGHWLGARTVLFTAVTAWCAVTAGFLGMHQRAVLAVDEFLARTDPTAVTLDRILTPLPANPLCWEVILVQLRSEQYSLRRATLALAPEWLTAAECPNRDLDAPTTAPLRTILAGNNEQWQWAGEWTAQRGTLATLTKLRCEAAAYLRFSRAPWWIRTSASWQLGDLRYDREPTAGFSEIVLDDDSVSCPRHPPPWQPPRSELLPDIDKEEVP
jgi:inner membrane protein